MEQPASFAYCAKSRNILLLAKRAYDDHAEKLGDFETAALLEDIFIW